MKKYLFLTTLLALALWTPTHAAVSPNPETLVFRALTFGRTADCVIYDTTKSVRSAQDTGRPAPLTHPEREVDRIRLSSPDDTCETPSVQRRQVSSAVVGAGTVGEAITLESGGKRKFIVQTELELDWIGQGIRGIYTAAISLATTLSVVFLMWAGIIWVSAAGNQNLIGKAKTYIANALVGLILTFGSYLILFTINPETANIRPIVVTKIAKQQFEFTPSTSGPEVTGILTRLIKRVYCPSNNPECEEDDFINQAVKLPSPELGEAIATKSNNYKDKHYGEFCQDLGDDDYCRNLPNSKGRSDDVDQCENPGEFIDYCTKDGALSGSENNANLRRIPIGGLCQKSSECIDLRDIALKDTNVSTDKTLATFLGFNGARSRISTCCAYWRWNSDKNEREMRCQYAVWDDEFDAFYTHENRFSGLWPKCLDWNGQGWGDEDTVPKAGQWDRPHGT